MRLRPSLIAIAAVLAVSGVAPAQTPPAPPTVAPPVNVAPSQPRAIDIQPAQPAAPPVAVQQPPAAPVEQEPLPPKITLIPQPPAAPPVAEAPPAQPPVVVETPDQNAEKAALRQRAYLVGAWVYEVAMPHGEPGRLRLVIRYREDGSFAGIAQFYQAGARQDVRIGGQWSLVPIGVNRFRLDTVGDKTDASITIEMLDGHRMLNLTNNVLMRRLTL